ncbi:hypothetical protein EJ06DRAFT_464434, partial [Trichodelitschia bisporula]
LPRRPDTVAAVMTYVCDSRMCEDFEGGEKVSVKERDRHVVRLGKRYGYGVREGADGGGRWVVDDM